MWRIWYPWPWKRKSLKQRKNMHTPKKRKKPPKVRLCCTFSSVAVKRRGCFSLLCQVSVRTGTSNSYPYHLSREAHGLAAKLSSGPHLGNDAFGSVTYTETIPPQACPPNVHNPSLRLSSQNIDWSVTINVNYHRLIPIGIDLYKTLDISINLGRIFTTQETKETAIL